MHSLLTFFKWLLVTAVILAGAIWAFLTFHPVWGGKPDAASLARINASKAFDGKQFQNLQETQLITAEKEISLLDWGLSRLRTPAGKNPTEPLPTEKIDFAAMQNGSLVWLGHSTVFWQLDGQRFLTDPVFYRASPVPFTGSAFAMTNPPQIADFPEIDLVLISHDHYDHLDYRAIKEIHPKTKHFIVPLGVKAHLVRWGVPEQKITELDWLESTTAGNTEITLVPGRHFSGRTWGAQNPTIWGGYVVQAPDLNFYFSADSGYGEHYKNIIAQYGPFDLVMIENGAYSEDWAQIHEFPEQTAQALDDLKARKVLPIHWGKFDLSTHKWTDPIERLVTAVEGTNIELATPKIGQVFNLNALPQQPWWRDVK